MQEKNESLYSRQLLVLGANSHQKLSSSKILILTNTGIDGLGQEIAKNLILAGVNVDIQFNKNLIKNYETLCLYFGKEGQSREIIVDKLRELNEYVTVNSVHYDFESINSVLKNKKNEIHGNEKSLTEIENLKAQLANYTLIISINNPLPFSIFLNDLLFSIKVPLIVTEQAGLSGYAINDFVNFRSIDLNGESPKVGNITITYEKCESNENDEMIIENKNDSNQKNCDEKISENKNESNKKSVIKNICKSVDRHNLESDDVISINLKYYKINVNTPFNFTIITDHEIQGDFYEEVKQEKFFNFKRIKEYENDELFFYKSIGIFRIKNDRMPTESDFEEIKEIFFENKKEIDNNLKLYLSTCIASFQPVISIMGGYVAQEALKCCSERFTPLQDLFFYDCYNIIPDSIIKYEIKDSVFRDLFILFGKNAFEIFNTKTFLVGAGAIGCEHLKNLYTQIIVTDMDSIEESNLNRQFLFRKNHIKEFKSSRASQSIMEMRGYYNQIDTESQIITENSEENKKNIFLPPIKSLTIPVNKSTENIFSDSFYENIDLFALALDNAEARVFMDGKSVDYRKPMFDSGTLGTKGHVQVVIPYLTESYTSSMDPPEKEIPLCTVRNFPYLIEHCIEWGLGQFNKLFVSNETIKNEEETEEDKELKKDEKISPFEMIDKNPPSCENESKKYAIQILNYLFIDSINNLIELFPRDHVTETGNLFWEVPKRFPQILSNEKEINELKELFINSCAILLNEVYKNGKKEPIEFEKDDDSNNHVNFIYAASNLRAFNYRIKSVRFLEVKRIAGKIIPAIATTTAMISGMCCVEIYRYILNKNKIYSSPNEKISDSEKNDPQTDSSKLEKHLNGDSFNQEYFNEINYFLKLQKFRFKEVVPFLNSFINLGLPFVTSSSPLEPSEIKCTKICSYNLWDKLKIKNCTINDLLKIFKNIDMISLDDKIIYCSWENNHKKNEFLIKDGEKKRIDILFEEECYNCISMYVES